jgi:hypothetical protein
VRARATANCCKPVADFDRVRIAVIFKICGRDRVINGNARSGPLITIESLRRANPVDQEQLVELQDPLSKGINAGDSDAADAIRGLVETVTVFRAPRGRGGVTIENRGPPECAARGGGIPQQCPRSVVERPDT